jgi:hypothetical protein
MAYRLGKEIQTMSKSYYVYNNEAIASLVLEKTLRLLNEIEISRFLLILPILLEDRIIVKLRTSNFSNFEELLRKHPTLFANFNDRYLDLLPISINSLTLLKEMGVLMTSKNRIFYNSNYQQLSQSVSSNRLESIAGQLENFVSLTAGYETNTLYKILKIRL